MGYEEEDFVIAVARAEAVTPDGKAVESGETLSPPTFVPSAEDELQISLTGIGTQTRTDNQTENIENSERRSSTRHETEKPPSHYGASRY